MLWSSGGGTAEHVDLGRVAVKGPIKELAHHTQVDWSSQLAIHSTTTTPLSFFSEKPTKKREKHRILPWLQISMNSSLIMDT